MKNCWGGGGGGGGSMPLGDVGGSMPLCGIKAKPGHVHFLQSSAALSVIAATQLPRAVFGWWNVIQHCTLLQDKSSDKCL